MIVTVYNNKEASPQKYSFTDELILIGRNPSHQSSVAINSETISRNHLKARIAHGTIQIMDLNSSNGTFLSQQKLTPNAWITITPNDTIKMAEFEGFVKFQIRQATINKPANSTVKTLTKKKQASESDDSSQRSRSRQNKQKKRELPFKISESTLKMLKDMTINKKSKQQRIKFLKLMGIGKAEQYWSQIEEQLKKKRGIRDNKKTSDDLQRLFSQGRSGQQKRGLGK